MSSSSAKEILECLLRDVAGLDENKVAKITAGCKTFQEFIQQSANWMNLYGLTREEIRKILNINKVTEKAMVDEKHEEIIARNCQDENIDFEKFYNENRERIETENSEMAANEVKKIYDIVFKHYTSSQDQLAIVAYLAPETLTIITKVVQITQTSASILKGIVASADELIYLVREIQVTSVVKTNIIGAGAMFVLLSVWSVRRNYIHFKNKTIKGHEFWTNIAIDAAANFSASGLPVTGGAIGAFIGNFIFPGLGALIGGIIGSVLGMITSKTLTEPALRDYLAKNSINKKQIEDITADQLYKEALNTLNVSDSTDKELIMRTRKNYLLALHPDKNMDSLRDENTEKLIKLEKAFKIIEGYRCAENRW